MTAPGDGLSDAPDVALLARYAAGDPAAARVLLARLSPMILGLSNRLLSDPTEAEDVTQEAMVRLWKIAPRWDADRAQVRTWLYKVTRNLCLDRLRKARGVGMDDMDELADDTPAVDMQMMTDDRTAALNAALAQLPERQRSAVWLRHIAGATNPEIAEVLGVSVEAVESLTARGKRSLARLLTPERAALGWE